MSRTRRMALGGIERKEVQLGGVSVHYEVAGAGDPVVLVHGLAGSTRWWYRNVPSLADKYTVYLIDLPGFGSMRRARHRTRLSQVHSWLRAWMRAVGIGSAHLVGHSMGGQICIRLAALHPETVRRLVLVSPAGVLTGRTLLDSALQLGLAARRANPSFLTVLFRDALRAGPWNILSFSQQILAEDVREELGSIVAPTLLVWGEYDRLVPASLAPAMRRAIPNSRLLMIRGVSHVPMFDRPKEFNRAVMAFLAGKEVGE